MRLITRTDLDGVVCAVLITQMEDVEQVVYAQPQDIEDGTVTVRPGDAIANLSYHPNAGLWFSHHDVAEYAPPVLLYLRGKWGHAPSSSRLVFDHYASPRLQKFEMIVAETDRFDSADLTIDDVLHPQDWVLLGFTLDPYMGLATFTGYANAVVAAIRYGSRIEQILGISEVRARVQLYRKDAEEFKTEIKRLSRLDGNILITDARQEDVMPVGNRFIAFALYPEAAVQIVLTHHSAKSKVRVRVARGIFNRSSKVPLGRLMARYGGGGLDGAAGCLLDRDEADAKIAEILAEVKRGW